MDKLIKIILEEKFLNIDINALVEIVYATPNPIVATEILCGVTHEPSLPKTSCSPQLQGDGDTLRTFESYDKWSREVKYSYDIYKHSLVDGEWLVERMGTGIAYCQVEEWIASNEEVVHMH
jgi:hypothetical protein